MSKDTKSAGLAFLVSALIVVSVSFVSRIGIDDRDSIHKRAKFELASNTFDLWIRMPLRGLRDVFLHILGTQRLRAAFTGNTFLFEEIRRHTVYCTPVECFAIRKTMFSVASTP